MNDGALHGNLQRGLRRHGKANDLRHLLLRSQDTLGQVPENILTVLETSLLYPHTAALISYYAHYTLGCWADGEQDVEIPLETAKLILNPKWKHLIQ